MNSSMNSTRFNTSKIANITENPAPDWSFMSVFWLVIFLSSFFTNAFLLLLFITHKHLMKAPFNTYLFNLLACNVLYAVLQNPMDLAQLLYPNYPYNARHCAFYMYLTRVLEAAMRNNHCLITFNRLWAVLSPMTYRLQHTRKIAYFAITASYLMIHVLMIPVVAVDSAYFYRRVTAAQCSGSYGHEPLSYQMLQAFFYDIQLLVVLGAYPIICWKRYLRARRRLGGGTEPPLNVVAVEPVAGKQSDELMDSRGTERTNPSGGVANSGTVPSGTGAAPLRHGGSGRSGSSKAFLVLSFLTLSVAVCWTPMLTTYTIKVLPGGSYTDTFVFVAVVLFSVQSSLDPLLFVVALSDLRDAVRLWFQCKKARQEFSSALKL